MNRILIVAAHPDDEILGCGATVARLWKEGNKAFTLIVGEDRDLLEDTLRANQIIGITEFEHLGFPDNKFDSVPLLRIVQSIEKVIKRMKPNVIFTHFRNDLNIDHELTYRAVITATRPIPNQTIGEIYSFEILSSTEWRYPLSFSPNIFFDVSDTIQFKEKAMDEYRTEIKDYPHPRSISGIRHNASLWGMKVGIPYAEAFELVRRVV